ncbi:site-specific integrase [Muricauda sp. SCSIO 64092]|uniref:tyrosine-type recombinase/integrase n=1 Tax=Allomuricauda sp. SCSIO 64092 TaxID=2908842 RepID=UPI001FF34D3B|nr:site-specific integrase [Muricauda sp. SCSIO 64092]UOY04980.1 site-specific integrase [Muricauda sp. SCSIO 64092]
MGRKKYTEPKIYHGGEDFDLSKRWYVYYSYESPNLKDKLGKPIMVRQAPVTMSINRKYKTKAERLMQLGIVKEVLLEMLKEGYSPYKDKLSFNSESLDYTVESALDYAYAIKITKLSDTSVKDYKSRYGRFKKYLDKKNLLDKSILTITKQMVNHYLHTVASSSSARNRNNTRIILSAIFAELEDNDIIPRNFVENIKVLDTKSVSHKTYSLKELEGLFAYMRENDPLLLLFVKFVSYNFLRPIEVCRLKVKDVFLSQKLLRFRAKNKPEKTKIIPDIVHNEIVELDFPIQDHYLFTPNGIGEWKAAETSRRDYFTKRFWKLKKRYNEHLIKEGKNLQLGPEYTIYSFRHTFITLLFRKFRKEYTYTETCDKLMLITGHSTLDALKSYLKDIDAELPEDYSGLLDLNL